MAQTNDEIINKHFPRTKEGFDIENVRDSINVLMNEARLAALDDCELFLKRVRSENPYRNNYGNIMWEKAILKALAELEALRKKVE